VDFETYNQAETPPGKLAFESPKAAIWGSEENKIIDANEATYVKSIAKSIVLADLIIIAAVLGIGLTAAGLIIFSERAHRHRPAQAYYNPV